MCSGCGKRFDAAPAPASGTDSPRSPADDAVMRAILPVGRSWVAIAAGYAGLFACLGFPAPLAIVLGIWAIVDLRKHPEKHGMGRAIFAIVMGIIGTGILIAFWSANDPYAVQSQQGLSPR
jgi:hypothetical protein